MHRDLPPQELLRLASLERENALLRAALERLPQGMCMFDAADRLLLANRRYLELWQLPPELGRPGTPFSAIRAATRGQETAASRERGQDAGTGTRLREWAMDDGRTIEVAVSREADGSCVALHEDVTEQRRAHSHIEHQARHDPLTGLPHRAALVEELQRQLARGARGGEAALLCLDLDRFKPVNDSLGHAAGDEVLRVVAARLRQCVRQSDLVARLGGDEFAVVQAGVDQPVASTALARRIVAALAQPIDIDGHPVHIGSSIGIAVAPFDGADPDRLLRSADLALYRAKEDGRGTFRYFEPEMDARVQARRGLEADLRRALDAGEFELAYQPQVALDGRRVSGVEALLRWRHPARGGVSPADFIPLAEETGLIVPIGRWVLQRACADACAWPADVRVAVNVSAVQLRRGSLLQDVEAALADSGLPPQRLEIEITESAMLHDTQGVIGTLAALRALGVQVAMDDFGTGYSSLSYLRSFPFDRIKIDRSFVADAAHDPEALSIIRAVTGLGRSLRMATTVEGVETAEQLRIVSAEGCSEVQGYLFSKPRPAAEVPGLIERLAGGAPPAEERRA